MSHFPVLVCLPGDTDLNKLDHVLAEVMDPWDENRSVEPYRSYEDGSPEEYYELPHELDRLRGREAGRGH